jgi:hypothetical protein
LWSRPICIKFPKHAFACLGNLKFLTTCLPPPPPTPRIFGSVSIMHKTPSLPSWCRGCAAPVYVWIWPTTLLVQSDVSGSSCWSLRIVSLASTASPLRVLKAAELNPLTLELNRSAQRCLTRFFTGDFASWTVHFVNIRVKNQQMQQLFIQFVNYVW